MSQQFTFSVADELVVILTKDNVAVTGLDENDVTAQLRKDGEASFSAFTLTGANFTEIGEGVYEIDLAATDVNIVGTLTMVVTGATIDQYTAIASVVAATQAATSVSLDTCILTGHVFDASGNAKVGAAVSARVLGLPSIEQNRAAVTDDRVSTTTDATGEFFLPLVRLADVELVIPEANYKRRLVVPNQATAHLFTGVT